MESRLIRSGARIAALLALACLGPRALPSDTGAGRLPDEGPVRFVDDPVLLGHVGDASVGRRLVGRPSGGHLLALQKGYTMVVAEHAEDGTREELRRLGALGYSGLGGLTALESLSPDSYVVAWDLDAKYSGVVRSRTAFVSGGERRITESGRRSSSVLVADGTGGAIGFFAHGRNPGLYGNDQRTVFARWDPSGRVVQSRPIRGSGRPLQAVGISGGIVLSSAETFEYDSVSSGNRLEWFDVSGNRLESVRGHGGGLASNRVDLLVEYFLSDDRRVLRARFGATPARLRSPRTVSRVPEVEQIRYFTAAVGERGETLFAWNVHRLFPLDEGCGLWVRAVDRHGNTFPGPQCVAGREVTQLESLSATPDGRFSLVWSSHGPDGAPAAMFRRTLEIDAD